MQVGGQAPLPQTNRGPDSMSPALARFAACLALLAAVATPASAQPVPPPAAGSAAPDFLLPDQDGNARNLQEFRGQWLVVFFYRKADTPPATAQAAGYRDAMDAFDALGARVVGVSTDDAARQGAFGRKLKLAFPLLADTEGEMARRYGSLVDFRVIRFARRNTFLINPEGKVARAWLGVDPPSDPARVLEDLKRLAGR
jgi:peroxiredoxin Q/BCP